MHGLSDAEEDSLVVLLENGWLTVYLKDFCGASN